MLASMLEVPNDSWVKDKNLLTSDDIVKKFKARLKLKGSFEYSFSHFNLETEIFYGKIKKAQLLNIPPLQLTEARKIKPKDKQLINSYFRDFYKDRTEHNKALERARQRRAEQEALGRRNSTRNRTAPERLIEVNSINLTAEALIQDSEELEYYYHNHDVGQIVKDVLQSTNIYK